MRPAVLGEFKVGLDVNTRRGKKVKGLLDDFLDDPAVVFVPFTDETADYYARIFKTLKANGTPIPTNDIWIAASAIEHGASGTSRLAKDYRDAGDRFEHDVGNLPDDVRDLVVVGRREQLDLHRLR